ncbi:TDT family transporter [Catenulispora yoronensis]|uniref:TDT family transporter n=1 Tax=Catenulispora yoronensis TaxID=450799 RepID=A0ABP5FZG3_9ACTN
MADTAQVLIPPKHHASAPANPVPAKPGTANPTAKHLRAAFRPIGPNWYASVMGTAIVANAGATLPGFASGVPRFAITLVWAAATLWLAVVLLARAAHWRWHADQARRDLLDPAVAPFYGCLSMAMTAVAAGTMIVGRGWIGEGAALGLAWPLWLAGTLVGLATAVVVPYLMMTRHELPPGSAAPAWLLPVVPPMVSAATGPQLVPHLAAGQARATMVFGCYAMFGISLLATLVILPLIFGKLVHHRVGALAATPGLFLVLGPLGQSVTAVNNLADVAPGAVGPQAAALLRPLAVAYGVPVLGFAMIWLLIASLMVVEALAKGMPFALTWWAFTFPVGTCVTGAAGLWRHTGLTAYAALAAALYVLLVGAWAVTAARTAGLVRVFARPGPSITAGRLGITATQ